MTHRCIKRSILITLVCLGLATILPAAALAGPGPGGKYGPVFRHVPPGGQIVRHGGFDYFFYSGRCYRHGPEGYFSVRPPMGIITYSLPATAAPMVISGVNYYMYDSVYYRKVPAGYQVVPVPTQPSTTTTTIIEVPVAEPQVPAASGSQVVVTAKILNVRSGPGVNHTVLTQAYMGNILVIQGNAPDWYYVRLPDNSYGWVMKNFVFVTGSGTQG